MSQESDKKDQHTSRDTVAVPAADVASRPLTSPGCRVVIACCGWLLVGTPLEHAAKNRERGHSTLTAGAHQATESAPQ
jgi:hypothetical protein